MDDHSWVVSHYGSVISWAAEFPLRWKLGQAQ